VDVAGINEKRNSKKKESESQSATISVSPMFGLDIVDLYRQCNESYNPALPIKTADAAESFRKLVALDIKSRSAVIANGILRTTPSAALDPLALQVLFYHPQQQETMSAPPLLLRPAQQSTGNDTGSRMTSLNGTWPTCLPYRWVSSSLMKATLPRVILGMLHSFWSSCRMTSTASIQTLPGLSIRDTRASFYCPSWWLI
jgi:hypothetical protein